MIMSRIFNERKQKILLAVIHNPGLRECELASILGLKESTSTLKNGLFDLQTWGYVWLSYRKSLRYWYPTDEGILIIKNCEEQKAEQIRSANLFPDDL